MKDISFNAVFTSDLQRAELTAAIAPIAAKTDASTALTTPIDKGNFTKTSPFYLW